MQIAQMKARPPHLRFHRVAVEDRDESLKEGRPIFKEVDHVDLTPIGSRDFVTKVVSEWLEQSRQQVQEERIPPDWVEGYQRAYEHWKRGEEAPTNGTPLKEWPAITPGELASCKAIHVLSIEDLAVANDETVRRLGMGGLALKQRAQRYLDASHDTNKFVAANSALQAQLADVTARRDELEKRVAQLEALVPNAKSPVQFTQAPKTKLEQD